MKEKVRHCFVREFCKANNLSLESPLVKICKASAIAIPKLTKLRKIIDDQTARTKELPCEVDLGSDLRFHNVFICPVTKEPACSSNVPMLMACGHVVSKNALARMARSERVKFKCHTCPKQMTRDEVKEMHIYWEYERRTDSPLSRALIRT
jgi:E3 ubiquitin-protein transferase RMND5